MIAKRRIVIAEDHTILREGLRSLLSSSPCCEVVGEAANGLEAIRSVRELKPDLLLIDHSMPKMNGFEAIREVKQIAPGIKVLVLTVHKEEEYILAAFQAGADGYLVKDDTHNELEIAIESVFKDRSYLSPGISDRVIDGFLSGRKDTKERSTWSTLTAREREILKLVAEGYRNREIAQYLFISVKTVEKHRANLMRKLNLHSASALTAYAVEQGLLSP